MSQVPKFASEAEEAEFWETHDVTEFLDDLPRESVTAHRGQVISVRVSQDDLDALKRLAAENGIGYTTLARMLIHRGDSSGDDSTPACATHPSHHTARTSAPGPGPCAKRPLGIPFTVFG